MKELIGVTFVLLCLIQTSLSSAEEACSGCVANEIKDRIEESRKDEKVLETVKDVLKAIRDNPNYEDAARTALRVYETQRDLNSEALPEVARQFTLKMDRMSTALYSGSNRLINQVFRPDERLYVFISSSIPNVTLSNYARFLEELFDERVFMVLRGCVGGCRLLKPTAEFVQSFLQYGVSADNRPLLRKVNVEIDPFLFKKYGITAVPAVVFCWDLEPDSSTVSEGLDENLKKNPHYIVAYGDASFVTVLEKMYLYLKENFPDRARSINNALKRLRKSTFSGDN